MSVMLPYGLQGQKLVSISSVTGGLACNCICPACKERLIARKGAKKIHHFAHYQGSGCRNGLETVLHLKAKTILQEAFQITLPPVPIFKFSRFLVPKTRFTIISVQLERKIKNVIPDAILKLQGCHGILLLEFTVTNAPDTIKLRKLRALGLPCLEIDLKKIYQSLIQEHHQWNEIDFKHKMLNETNAKTWIFNPKQNLFENLIAEKALLKRVRTFINRYGGQHFYVKDCPLSKRVWKNSFSSNRSYAKVFQDCIYCSYCFEIRYEEHFRANRYIPTIPKEVSCFAHIKDDYKFLANR